MTKSDCGIDIDVSFGLSGQHATKTESSRHINHVPSGLVVCQDEWSAGPAYLRRRDMVAGLAGLALAALVPGEFGATAAPRLAFDYHRFGVNYVPSQSWYFCWNDWHPGAIARDFDAIASLGADHIRIILIWPWFQPNPGSVSAAHLDRLDSLLTLAGERQLDVLVTVFTGWLSGFAFRPPFLESEPFYTSTRWEAAQDLYLSGVARRAIAHTNFLGFDIGNEINCCWGTASREGDAWMHRIFERMRMLAPGRVYVNGVDHKPWFEDNSFSPDALSREQPMVALHSWPFWTGAAKYGGPLSAAYTQLPAALTALVRALCGDPNKPVWLQEFGACSAEMPEAFVIPWMETAIVASIHQGVSWFTWWASHDVSRDFKFDPFEYDLGLLDLSNRRKPRGDAFRRLASTYRGRRVNRPGGLAKPPQTRTAEATWDWLLSWLDSSQ